MPVNSQSISLKRPVVSRDGSVYWIRRLIRLGRSQGVYLPKQLVEAAEWTGEEALMVWMQGETILIRRLEVAKGQTRLIPIPPRGRRSDKVPPDEEA